MPTRIVRRDCDETILLESDRLTVLIDPRAGGKIRSFFSKRTETEFFYVDPRETHEPGDDYSAHDISGFDECFPTVWPCDYPDGRRRGTPMGDHGYLWQGPWRAEIDGHRLHMSKEVPQFQCRFERTCTLDSTRSLSLDYAITNYGDQRLKYIYSAHPLLAAAGDTRLILPDEIDKMFVFFTANVPGFCERTWTDWPPPERAGLGPPLSGSRQSCVKLYSAKLTTGRAAVHHVDRGQALQLEFDVAQLPYLGVLIQQGYDPEENGAFKGELFIALEPTTGIGDDLPTCQTTGTVAEILPGESMSFSTRLTLLDV